MTAKTAATPATAPVNYADLIADLGGLPVMRPRPTRAKSTADYRHDVDLAIITAAGKLVTELVPEKHRADVARLVSNQLHHLSTPKVGWPSPILPMPDRADWR